MEYVLVFAGMLFACIRSMYRLCRACRIAVVDGAGVSQTEPILRFAPAPGAAPHAADEQVLGPVGSLTAAEQRS